VPPAAQLLVILAAVIVFWAVVMRPARAQQKKVEGLQRSLEVGQQVVLSAGIFGTIRALDEGRVQLEIAPGTIVTVARQVVVRRAEDVPAGTATDDPTPAGNDDTAPRHED
jgi:preprotein translocase subunit YajC